MRFTRLALTCLTLANLAHAEDSKVIEQLREESKAVAPLVKTEFANRFLQAVDKLPPVAPKSIYRKPTSRTYLSVEQIAKLPEAERKSFKETKVNESLYYVGRYGTPLAYCRALDLVAEAGGLTMPKPRVLDFGYGAIGQIEMLSAMGADVVGVDVDPLLPILYAEAFTNRDRPTNAARGKVQLLNGKFPSDADIRAAAGGNFDLFISKNTLKNGYIHPAEKVDKRMTIDLGVSDEEFVRAMNAVLRPGGFAMIYNLCPAPAPPGKPYIPWADGRCPFPKAMLEKCGFQVLVFDIDDGPAGRAMAKALGWSKPPSGMNLEKDLFIWYTLLRKSDSR